MSSNINIILFQGVKGGTGTTTVVSNVAESLNALGHEVFVLDCCEQNLLRIHFGACFDDNNGWARQAYLKLPWQHACYRTHSGVNFIPFGFELNHNLKPAAQRFILSDDGMLELINTLSCLKERDEQERNEEENNQNIDVNLAEDDFLPQHWLLIDSNNSLSANTQSKLFDFAQLEIQILKPDAAGYACLLQQNINGFLKTSKRRYLINGYSPMILAEQDIHNVLQAEFKQQFVPLVIHQDLHIPEAMAQKQTAFSGAPHSQAYRDFNILANWLTIQFHEQNK